MQYARKHESGLVEYPYTYDMLRVSLPDTCWPDFISEAALAGHGVQYVAPGARPNYNQATQKIICFVDTTTSPWSEVWGVVDMTEAEQEIFCAEEAKRIRKQRDILLQDVDAIGAVRWAMMSKLQQNAWKRYRQALLDVPKQVGFPFIIDWPPCPS